MFLRLLELHFALELLHDCLGTWKYLYFCVIRLYETQDGGTALIKASAKGHYEVVKLLLSAQANVNQSGRVRNCIHASCVFDMTLSMLAYFNINITVTLP